MPIYDKPVRTLLPEMIAELASDPSRVFTKEEAVRWFADRYPKIRNSTVAAHLIRFSTNAPSRLHYNVQPGEDLLFQIDGGRFRLFDPAHDPAPIHPSTSEEAPAPTDDASEPEPPSEFAYERDLQQFLARNLSLIERGLQLYEEEGIPGIEFPVGGRFVDILALDAQRNFVVVELKVSKAYDRVVGQLLRYMAWVKANHAEPEQTVRGIIVAREISTDLRLACSQVPGISLFEYRLSVSLTPVTSGY